MEFDEILQHKSNGTLTSDLVEDEFNMTSEYINSDLEFTSSKIDDKWTLLMWNNGRSKEEVYNYTAMCAVSEIPDRVDDPNQHMLKAINKASRSNVESVWSYKRV